ncbi:carbohydrate ABC transporter permease [Streptomyces sp. NPDC014870]|uniref:carbohydrate ABC transporter permease n=1 Tax=Streptomyces sp. NPDC014870 TaxID=3364925 RepID=UPI0036F8DD02
MTTVKPSGRPPWAEKPSPFTTAAKGVALTIVLVLMLTPFLVVVSTSLAGSGEVAANGGWVLWPEHPTTGAYRTILHGGVVTRAMVVSIALTVFGSLASLACTTFLAFALSRPRLVGGKPLLMLILFTFLFPPGIIPAFLMVKQTGLFNSYLALALPVLVNVFNLVVMRGFFQGIPEELFEAARLDGAGYWGQLRHVVLPLSKAVLAVVGLFYAVSYWNSWFTAMVYLDDSGKWPLTQVLRYYVIQGVSMADPTQSEAGLTQAPQTVQMAVVVMATVPILLVYPFLQRFFVKGVLTGAIKS